MKQSKGTKDRNKYKYWQDRLFESMPYADYAEEVEGVMNEKAVYELRKVYWQNVFHYYTLCSLEIDAANDQEYADALQIKAMKDSIQHLNIDILSQIKSLRQ